MEDFKFTIRNREITIKEAPKYDDLLTTNGNNVHWGLYDAFSKIIAIREDLKEVDKTNTILHELAHAFQDIYGFDQIEITKEVFADLIGEYSMEIVGICNRYLDFKSRDPGTNYDIIEKHECVRPDEPPIEGEWWLSRSVGYDLSGFVKCKPAGERIIQMIADVIGKKPTSWFDFRSEEPIWALVTINESDGFDLKLLHNLCSDGIITLERLKQSLI